MVQGQYIEAHTPWRRKLNTLRDTYYGTSDCTAFEKVSYTKHHCLLALHLSVPRIYYFPIESTEKGRGYAKKYPGHTEMTLEVICALSRRVQKTLELITTKENVSVFS